MSRNHYKGTPKYVNALLSPGGDTVTMDRPYVNVTEKSFRWTWSATDVASDNPQFCRIF